MLNKRYGRGAMGKQQNHSRKPPLWLSGEKKTFRELPYAYIPGTWHVHLAHYTGKLYKYPLQTHHERKIDNSVETYNCDLLLWRGGASAWGEVRGNCDCHACSPGTHLARFEGGQDTGLACMQIGVDT